MIELSCDVLVVGGGVAGSAAAVAAARDGAHTILVEQETYLGGTGYAGMFQHICGLYLNGDTFPKETLNSGITREIVGLLKQKSPGKREVQVGQVFVLPYDRNALRSALESLCSAEKKLTLMRGCVVRSVDAEVGEVKAVTVEIESKQQSIAASMMIDCSGNGEIAANAGAAYEFSSPDERQLAGYVIHLKGLSNPEETLSIKVPYHLAQAVQRGYLPPLTRLTTFSFGDTIDEGYCKMSMGGNDGHERNERARKDATEMLSYLARTLPSFQNAWIAGTSLKVLDREGRRICGEYTLTEQDILSARKFSDGIVKNAWPIELWNASKGTSYRYVPRGDYYDIAFRCMIVKGFKNLLCAGRCISVTHAALGSTRVMGTCMALGEHAGRAAAYRVRHGKYPEL
jgi:hypothetical protein